MYIDALKNAKKITVPKGHEPHLYEITPRIAKEMLDRHNARNPRRSATPTRSSTPTTWRLANGHRARRT